MMLTSKLMGRFVAAVVTASMCFVAMPEVSRADDNAATSKKEYSRVSNMMGKNIQNSQGNEVGEVADLMLNPETGRVDYVAVTYGGLLGIGNKMYAVPFQAFQCKAKPGSPHDHVLILDVTQEQVEKLEGFDEDNWPDFSDPKIQRRLNESYGVKGNRRRGLDVNVNASGLEVDVN